MSLVIVQQDSLYSETQAKNGKSSLINYVIKNTPFKMSLTVTNVPFDFQSATLQCSLLYDLPDQKKVESVNSKPLEYLMTPSADGKTCSVQFRISVLSTQHHSNFLISCMLIYGSQYIETISQSIKSCSKLEQIRRKIAEKEGKQNPAPKKKRARSDELLDTLQQIKNSQIQQTELLKQLAANFPQINSQSLLQMNDDFNSDGLIIQDSNVHLSSMTEIHPVMQVETSPPTLETAIHQLIDALASASEEERPTKLRKIASSVPAEKKYLLAQVGEALCAASNTIVKPEPEYEIKSTPPMTTLPNLGSYNYNDISPSLEPFFADSSLLYDTHSDRCGLVCSHQRELENWNNYVLQSFLLQDDEC